MSVLQAAPRPIVLAALGRGFLSSPKHNALPGASQIRVGRHILIMRASVLLALLALAGAAAAGRSMLAAGACTRSCRHRPAFAANCCSSCPALWTEFWSGPGAGACTSGLSLSSPTAAPAPLPLRLCGGRRPPAPLTVHPTPTFPLLADNPHGQDVVTNIPRTTINVDVVVVGSGFAGMTAVSFVSPFV